MCATDRMVMSQKGDNCERDEQAIVLNPCGDHTLQSVLTLSMLLEECWTCPFYSQ